MAPQVKPAIHLGHEATRAPILLGAGAAGADGAGTPACAAAVGNCTGPSAQAGETVAARANESVIKESTFLFIDNLVGQLVR